MVLIKFLTYNVGGYGIMRKIFDKVKRSFKSTKEVDADEVENEYLELNTDAMFDKSSQKILVRPFTLEDFSDVKTILDSLREGYTIALINIGPLKDKDVVELKRAINKLKKTCDAMEGDIAGFGEDYIVVGPSFVKIHRNPQSSTEKIK